MTQAKMKPMDEEQMKLRFIGNAPLWKLFASLITIPTVIIATAYILLQNEGGEYKVTHKVFFDIEIAGDPQPRVVIGLFGETVPRTVQNFYTLATDGYDGNKYQGSQFHRVIKNFLIQGGDVVNHDGTGSISIFGTSFPDENFQVKHVGPGYLSMANQGPDTNGCQFFISLVAATWLDGKHVVFGKVLEGEETLTYIEYVENDGEHKPLQPVAIAKSGKLPVDKPFFVSNDPYNFYDWARTVFPAIFCTVIIVFFFDKVSKMLDRGIDIHDIIIKELEEKHAKEEAEVVAAAEAAAAAAAADAVTQAEPEEEGEEAELITEKTEEERENVRKRH